MNGNIDSLVSSMEKLSSERDNGPGSCLKTRDECEQENKNNIHFRMDFPNEKLPHNDHQPSMNYKGTNNNSNHGTITSTTTTVPTNIYNINHHSHYLNDKKFKSYKLITDPCLIKGAQKYYRYDGIVSSKENAVQPKDPRNSANVPKNLQIDFIIPRFKIDKNYVGLPPSIEVSITNLNDNINKTFLEDTIKKYDAIEDIEIFYHPKTKKHLGLAKVLFMTSSGAKACVNKLNQTSVMGNIINVFFDPFGKKINQIYESIVNPPSNMTGDNFIDPNNLDKSLSRMAKNSEYGYDISSDYCSTFSTPTFENQSFYSSNQYYDGAQNWKSSNLTNSDHDKSPIRESLETRINNLLRQNRVGLVSKFLNESQNTNLSLPHFSNNDYLFSRRNSQKKLDDSDAILGTPPSPFISASEYLKWHQITKEIDSENNDKIENMERFKSDSDNKKNSKNDDDDDRMSLSSLSSGEKFEDNPITTNTIFSNANDHLSTMISGITNWNSDANHPFNHDQTSGFNNSLYPQFMYNSFVQNSSQPYGYFAGFTVPSTLGSLTDPFMKKSEIFFNDKNKISKFDEEDLLNRLLIEAANMSIKDLKEILRKDIYKKIVEKFSFKMFDQWWEDSERNSKSNDVQLDPTSGERSSPTLKRAEIHIPFFNNPMFENSIQNRHTSLTSNFEYGVSRGLRAAMGKMPSFKKKIIKKSPTHSIDEKLSDISDVEDYVNNKKSAQRISRYRRNRSISSESIPSPSHSVSSSHSSSSNSSLSPSSSSLSSSSFDDDDDDDDDDRSFSTSDESEVSGEIETSDSETLSDTSLSSTPSKKSLVSINSSHSSRLTKTLSETTRKEEPITMETYDSDTSGTRTADEAIEEMNREFLSSLEKEDKNDLEFNDIKKSKTMEEFEASEALISLANWIDNQTNAINKNELNQTEFIDCISLDHNYCRPIVKSPTPTANKKRIINTEKRKRKTKEIQNNNENVTPANLAVASEWRKAKRKAISVHIDMDKNNENINKSNNENEILMEPTTFLPRSLDLEEEVMFESERNGLDSEDNNYLKRCYTQLLQEENNNLPWLNDIHWVDHPSINIYQPTMRKRRKLDDPIVRIHQTGCARSEGYYKLNRMEKMYHVANIPIASNDNEDGNALRSKQIVTTQQLTREARNQRRLLNLVEQNNYHTDLLKLNQLKFRKKQVKFARSKIHVWGLFAMQPIPPDEMVIEYIGQRIRPMVADIREKKYSNAGSSYFFKIDSDTIIDATHCGNVARFINHSCSPNCYAKVITVEGQKRIVIYSKQLIDVGHEITYDYKFPIEEDNKIPCLCRSSQCRGFLN